MTDVAAAAGVARATVYRYFPTREVLLSRVAEVALSNAAARLREAQLDRVSVREAVVRAVRGLLDVGDFFTVVASQHVEIESNAYEHAVGEPLRALIRRGQDAGEIRIDLPEDSLATALIALVSAVSPSLRSSGRDETVAAVSDLFLEGAYTAAPAGAGTK